jgi:hypothetical protein
VLLCEEDAPLEWRAPSNEAPSPANRTFGLFPAAPQAIPFVRAQKKRRRNYRKYRKVARPPSATIEARLRVLRSRRCGRLDHGSILSAASGATYFGRWKSSSADGTGNRGRFDSRFPFRSPEPEQKKTPALRRGR